MKAKNTNREEMEKALAVINKKYNNNIIWNRFDEGKTINFTLRCKSSKEAGHRRGFPSFDGKEGKRLTSACWHVHGDFFDALLVINENAVIISGGSLKIDKNGGNWQDRNIGSQMRPLYFSEACDCN